HVAPPSRLRKSPAGSTPAYSASGPAVTFQIVVTLGPSSPYVRPSLEWLHDCPRSSLRQTAGPYQLLPPAASTAPDAGSTIAPWIGQPSHSGPRTSHESRVASPSITNRPLRVPTRSATRSAISILRTFDLPSAYSTVPEAHAADDPGSTRLPVHAQRRRRRGRSLLRRRARRGLRLRDRGRGHPRRDGRARRPAGDPAHRPPRGRSADPPVRRRRPGVDARRARSAGLAAGARGRAATGPRDHFPDAGWAAPRDLPARPALRGGFVQG